MATTTDEAVLNELDIFSVPPTLTAVESEYYQEVRPLSQLNDYSSLEFDVQNRNATEYINLRKTKLWIKVKIIHKDKTPLIDQEKTSVVNNFMNSLFSQVELYMQGKLVQQTVTFFPYLTYFLLVLDSGGDAIDSQLTSQLFYLDVGTTIDTTDPNGGSEALFQRGQFVQKSKPIELEGPLLLGLFQNKRYLINNTSFQLKMHRTAPEFSVISAEKNQQYDVVIEDAALKVCKVRVNPSVVYAHSLALQKTNASYFFTRHEVKTSAISQGLVSYTWDNCFLGQKPKQIVFGFTSSAGLAGNYGKNPFSFKPFDIAQVMVFVDGTAIGDNARLSWSDDSENFLSAYDNVFSFNGEWRDDSGIGISRDDFKNGYTLFCYNLEAIYRDRDYLSLMKRANLRIQCQFATPLPEPVTMVLMGTFPAYMQIDSARNIIQ